MQNPQKIKQNLRNRRHKRVRSRIKGTIRCPRLSVFRSHKHIYAQLIDDEKGKTLVAASDQELKLKIKKGTGKTTSKTASPMGQVTKKLKVGPEKEQNVRTKKVSIAYEIGKLIAKKAFDKKIKKVVFDRGGYKYHGRVRSLAEGAREGGLEF